MKRKNTQDGVLAPVGDGEVPSANVMERHAISAADVVACDIDMWRAFDYFVDLGIGVCSGWTFELPENVAKREKTGDDPIERAAHPYLYVPRTPRGTEASAMSGWNQRTSLPYLSGCGLLDVLEGTLLSSERVVVPQMLVKVPVVWSILSTRDRAKSLCKSSLSWCLHGGT